MYSTTHSANLKFFDEHRVHQRHRLSLRLRNVNQYKPVSLARNLHSVLKLCNLILTIQLSWQLEGSCGAVIVQHEPHALS